MICLISDASKTPKELTDFTVTEEDNKKTYRCNKCGKITTTRCNMIRHISYAHIQEKHACVCDVCKKEFTNELKLKDHMRSSHTPHECPDCHRQIHRKIMRHHRAVEHGVGTHTCGICGYKSDNRSVMEHQRRVHIKEKKVPCLQCGMMFFDTSYMKIHMMRHNPAKEFGCKFCKKMFRRPDDVRRHEKIHTGDKRKLCNVCGDRFVQKSSLTHHMKTRHPGEVLKQLTI